MERQRKEFTSIAQLQQTDLFLQVLEFKLRAFNQLLSRLDRWRSLVYLGGTILKKLFVTAIVNDFRKHHDVLTELKSRNSDIQGCIQKFQDSTCKKEVCLPWMLNSSITFKVLPFCTNTGSQLFCHA